MTLMVLAIVCFLACVFLLFVLLQCGVGGIIAPFIGIKVIDVLLTYLQVV
jgi:high-affinity K+ transport system ATPase subunit B